MPYNYPMSSCLQICDAAIRGRSTSATWNPMPQTWSSPLRTFCWPRFGIRNIRRRHGSFISWVYHNLHRKESCSGSTLGNGAHRFGLFFLHQVLDSRDASVPAPLWGLAPTCSLPLAQHGTQWASLAACETTLTVPWVSGSPRTTYRVLR